MSHVKIKLHLIFILLLVWSCDSATNNTRHSNNVNEDIVDDKQNLSTVLKDSVFYSFTYTGNDSFNVLWVDRAIRKSSEIKLTNVDVKSLVLFAHNDSYILLKRPCGGSCTYFLILPILSNQHEKEYLFVKTVDLEQEIIVYASEHNGQALSISLENFKTKKRIEVSEVDVCEAINKAECLRNCELTNGKLVYCWDGKNGFMTKTLDLTEIVCLPAVL